MSSFLILSFLVICSAVHRSRKLSDVLELEDLHYFEIALLHVFLFNDRHLYSFHLSDSRLSSIFNVLALDDEANFRSCSSLFEFN